MLTSKSESLSLGCLQLRGVCCIVSFPLHASVVGRQKVAQAIPSISTCMLYRIPRLRPKSRDTSLQLPAMKFCTFTHLP